MLCVPEGVSARYMATNQGDLTTSAGNEPRLGPDLYYRRSVLISRIIPAVGLLWFVSSKGMTTIEHNLPIPELYDDVLTLFALSGTGATPTHIVNYGGVHGEQLVWARYDVPNDPK